MSIEDDTTADGNPLVPSGQPYYGPYYDQGVQSTYPIEPWERDQLLVGSISPPVKKRIEMQNGRYLSGVGNSPDGIGRAPNNVACGGSGGQGVIGSHAECAGDKELLAAEREDDVYGSGIFSGPGTDYGRATANADMGIYSSNYTLPGYLGREVPYAVSRDVSDPTAGADVVYMPGGGMSYVERDGQVVGYDVLGPTPRGAKWQTQRAPTTLYQPYADLTAGNRQPMPPQNAGWPVRSAPAPRNPPRTFRGYARGVPSQQTVTRGGRPQLQRRVPYQSTVYPAYRIQPIRQLGQEDNGEDKPPSTAAMFLWGSVLGVGLGLGAAWLEGR